MEMYYIMILCGVLALLIAARGLNREMVQRQKYYKELLHTKFCVCNSNEAMDLACTYYVVGRRKRRCDISLRELRDMSISKVHAILWYDGHSFCIKPVCVRKLFGKSKYSILHINGRSVPPGGSRLSYGDVIRMGNNYFVLEDSRKQV